MVSDMIFTFYLFKPFRYDRERETFNFVKQIQKEKELSFTYTSDFDDQGIVYWLGTNGRTSAEWNNPGSIAIVKVCLR